MKSYHLSASGQRTTLVLLAGALAIWAFAIWTLRSSLVALGAEGPTVGQIIPALLMVVLIVATPLVIWNLLEEWSASYTPSEDGLEFRALGIRLSIPWSSITGLRADQDDEDDQLHELLIDQDYTGQIANPLVRLLHAQAYGRRKLPIFGGVAEREQLLAAIAQHTGHAQPPAAEALA